MILETAHPGRHLRARLRSTPSGAVDGGRPLLEAIAGAVSESIGFATVAMSLYREEWDDFEVVVAHGSDEARARLVGRETAWDVWRPLLDDRFRVHGAYFVRHGAREDADAEDPPSVRDVAAENGTAAWHPDDILLAPMVRPDGRVLGIISVDEPLSGRRPREEQLVLLVALADEAARALEAARQTEAGERDRAALEQLLHVSSQLPATTSVDSVLQSVCDGIYDVLGFDHVVIELVDREGDRYRPRAGAGVDLAHADLELAVPIAQLDRIFEPQFEIEGCYLLSMEEAASRVGASPTSFASTMNGRGPHAWNRHWLIVPLHAPDGERIGFIWVDDPRDRLVPPRSRLQALRLFANQAATALASAAQFEALQAANERLARRNAELEARNETIVDLLTQRELSNVLEAIAARAATLVGAQYGDVYLVDEGGESLRLAVTTGVSGAVPVVAVRRGEGLAGRVWEEARLLAVDDYSRWEGRVRAYDVITSAAAVPLRAGGDVVGVLGVGSGDPERAFGEEELRVLDNFGWLASLALENARLHDAAQRELAERREAEEALRKSRELYRAIVENSTDIIALLDLGGRPVYVSPAASSILGYTQEELGGTLVVDNVHPDDVEDAAARIAACLTGDPPEPYMVRVAHNDGSWRLLEGVPAAIRNEAGEPELVLVVARDVTERQRHEEARAKLEERLRQGQKMEAIGRLAGGVAHDFNNLLTAIGGYADLALAGLEPRSGVRRNLEEIQQASERAAGLTRQLLAFSRRQVLQPTVLDLNEVVAGLEGMLARLLGEHIEITAALAPDLARTRADRGQIEQVLMNLVINARDAMPRGGRLTIETANAELDREFAAARDGAVAGRYVMLAVRDTGEGMDAETLARVFEPFFTTKRAGEGTGLGLATAYGIVKQTGGQIWADSEPGVGSTFNVYLPPVSEPAAASEPSPEHPDRRGSETVLVVEDEDVVRMLVCEMLERAGYRVLAAEGGEEALALAAAHDGPIDVLLTDVVMPGVSGQQLAARLMASRPEIRVLFISGYTEDAIANHGVLRPGTAFLEKPFGSAELARKLREVLDASRAA